MKISMAYSKDLDIYKNNLKIINVPVEVVLHVQASDEWKTNALAHHESAVRPDHPLDTLSALLQTVADGSLMHGSIL